MQNTADADGNVIYIGNLKRDLRSVLEEDSDGMPKNYNSGE